MPKTQRKSLAGELDRLDSIIDALDVGLTGAVKDAVREAVSTAVSETVRATLLEIVTNPDVLVLLRSLNPVVVQPSPDSAPTTATQPCLSTSQRLRQSISSAWTWSLSKVKAAGNTIASRYRKIRDGAVSTFQKINLVWRLKRRLLIAFGVGVTIGTLGYFASPGLAGVLTGIGAMGTTLGAQLALWAKRIFGSVPLS